MWSFPLFPRGASTHAGQVDYLYFALIGVSTFFAAAIVICIILFSIRYRRGTPADRSPITIDQNLIEITWTLVPLAIVMGLFTWGAILYFRLYVPPAGASEIYVVGKQWMWKVQHPEGQREIDELHLPLGQPVKLLMTSQDVIHSFYVPAFRAKQDVLPGRYTTFWFQPDRIGEYHLFCAEYCGTDHARMGGRVIVMAAADYQAWAARTNVTGSMADAGRKQFQRLGCTGCHGANSIVKAPRLEGLFGKPVPLASGEVVIADESYIRDSILLPLKQIAAGYAPIMPTFQGVIQEDELMEIIAYLRSTSDQERTGP